MPREVPLLFALASVVEYISLAPSVSYDAPAAAVYFTPALAPVHYTAPVGYAAQAPTAILMMFFSGVLQQPLVGYSLLQHGVPAPWSCVTRPRFLHTVAVTGVDLQCDRVP